MRCPSASEASESPLSHILKFTFSSWRCLQFGDQMKMSSSKIFSRYALRVVSNTACRADRKGVVFYICLLVLYTYTHSLRKVEELVEELNMPKRTRSFFLEKNTSQPKKLTTMAFKMIVALSGILLVSELYDQIFQELRKQNTAFILQ